MSKKRLEELTKESKDFLNYKESQLSIIDNTNKLFFIDLFNTNESAWNNYYWQISNTINSDEIIKSICNFESKNQKQVWGVTPHFLSLSKDFNYTDPIFAQVIPSELENNTDWGEPDPMNEANTKYGRITRRYPDRLIINVTNKCFSYCRYCQRKRNFSDKTCIISKQELDLALHYIKEHKEIRDVLITGGDPLTLNDSYLINIIHKLKSIKHIEIIRIGTRVLSFIPQRITASLVKELKQYSPIYINSQFNHPYEISKETEKACELLSNNGIILGNQSVLLKGINDNTFTIQLLNQLLVKNRIRPYYIFHPKYIVGTHHFYVSLSRGIDIIDSLRGYTSGLCIPTYIINSPKGYGKVNISKNNIEVNNNNVTLTTWEKRKIIINNDYEL